MYSGYLSTENLEHVFTALDTTSELWNVAEQVYSVSDTSMNFLLTSDQRKAHFPSEATEPFRSCLPYYRNGLEDFLVPGSGSCCVFSPAPVKHSTARLTVNTNNAVKANQSDCFQSIYVKPSLWFFLKDFKFQKSTFIFKAEKGASTAACLTVPPLLSLLNNHPQAPLFLVSPTSWTHLSNF